jgi:hypothetical protein
MCGLRYPGGVRKQPFPQIFSETASIPHPLFIPPQLSPAFSALSLAASHYLDFAERRFARKTYQYKKMILKKLVEHLGDREMEGVRPVQVQEFLLTRPSNHNFNVAHKQIGAFWNYAVKTMNLPVANPNKDIDRMPERDFIKYIPPQKDVLALLTAAGEHRPMLQVIIGTLSRIDEVLRMRWPDVNFKTRSVRLWTRKNKDGSWRHRDIPMNESLLEVLKGARKKGAGGMRILQPENRIPIQPKAQNHAHALPKGKDKTVWLSLSMAFCGLYARSRSKGSQEDDFRPPGAHEPRYDRDLPACDRGKSEGCGEGPGWGYGCDFWLRIRAERGDFRGNGGK